MIVEMNTQIGCVNNCNWTTSTQNKFRSQLLDVRKKLSSNGRLSSLVLVDSCRVGELRPKFNPDHLHNTGFVQQWENYLNDRSVDVLNSQVINHDCRSRKGGGGLKALFTATSGSECDRSSRKKNILRVISTPHSKINKIILQRLNINHNPFTLEKQFTEGIKKILDKDTFSIVGL